MWTLISSPQNNFTLILPTPNAYPAEKETIKTECLESFITFLRNLGLTGLKQSMFKDAFDDAKVPLPSDIGEPEESLEVKAVAEELANAEAETDAGIESIEAAG